MGWLEQVPDAAGDAVTRSPLTNRNRSNERETGWQSSSAQSRSAPSERPLEHRNEAPPADRDRLVAEHLTGSRGHSRDRVRALAHICTEHNQFVLSLHLR
jgi:hypothetical protein